MTTEPTAPSSAYQPYPAGTYVVRIEVPEGHEIGPGQLLCRVSDALRGKVSPYPLAYDGLKVSFEPTDANGDSIAGGAQS